MNRRGAARSAERCAAAEQAAAEHREAAVPEAVKAAGAAIAERLARDAAFIAACTVKRCHRVVTTY